MPKPNTLAVATAAALALSTAGSGATRDAESTTRMMPPQMREVRLLPNTYNEETRTIECVWTAGARVRRYNWWTEEYYDEELEVSDDAVDMTRLASGACAVLDNHRVYGGLQSQIGVVERAWIKDGQGHAVLRLSARDDLAGIVADIVGGIIRNISVGYTVQRYEITREEGEVPLYRAVRWAPHEISFVTVPADAASTTRNAPDSAQGSPCVFIRADGAPKQVETSMPNPAARAADPADNQQETAAAVAAQETEVDTATGTEDAAADATRAADIVDLATRHGFGDRAADWIRAGHSIDKVRELILDSRASADDATGGRINRVEIAEDEADKQRSAAVSALLARAQVIDPSTERVFRVEGANPLRGMTLLELARRSLERIGIRTDGMDKRELVGRAFTQSTSDFPVLLENTLHKALQAAYAIAPDTWTKWARQGEVSDFRAHNRYRVGSIGNLDAVNELGEFKNKAIPDGEKATITAATKGNIINLSRQAIINDDLGAFIGLAVTLGRAAKRTIEADAYAFLASNPVMSDGIALFHADHNNLESAGAPTVATIGAASDKMAVQKGVGGHDILDLRPAVFLGNKANARAADVVVGSQFDPDSNNKLQRKNSVYGEVSEIVGTGRIADDKWYLFADPQDAPVIEVAFLDGITEPFLDQEEGFTVDGTRWKVRLDYGIAAIDFRGAVRNG